MLKISKLADYATVIMTFLAQHPNHRYSATAIAEQTHLGVPTVTKLLKRLAEHQLLKSIRGTQGGYQLNLLPQTINVAKIIAAVDGDFGITECGQIHSKCVHEKHCDIRGNWRYINAVVLGVLENITLAEMCEALIAKPLVFHPKIAHSANTEASNV